MKRGQWLRRHARALGIVTLGVIVLSVVVGVTVFASAPKSIPNKRTILSQMNAQATALANGPHGVKHPVTPSQSCPMAVQVGVRPNGLGGAEFSHTATIQNQAVALSSSRPAYVYVISAGAERSNPQQGLIIVEQMARDSCAPGVPGTQIHYYPTPYQHGALTLTKLSEDTVLFSIAGGSSGSFDFVTGVFQ
jgi:hypothetical protein